MICVIITKHIFGGIQVPCHLRFLDLDRFCGLGFHSVCGREHDDVTQKCEKTSSGTYIVVHFTWGVEEAILFIYFN